MSKAFRSFRRILVVVAVAMSLQSARVAEAEPAAASAPPREDREAILWLNVWLPSDDVQGLPSVLLIGDSITQGYYEEVAKLLNGKAVVGRMTTSRGAGDHALLAEVRLVLDASKFDVIHFNNGLHGWEYTEEEYAKSLHALVATIREGAPGAKLIFANTTGLLPGNKPDQAARRAKRAKRVGLRNEIAAKVMADEKIPINDLHNLVSGQPALYAADGTHFIARGKAILGHQVADHVLRALQSPP